LNDIESKILRVLRAAPEEGLTPSEIRSRVFAESSDKVEKNVNRSRRQLISRFLAKRADTHPELTFQIEGKVYCPAKGGIVKADFYDQDDDEFQGKKEKNKKGKTKYWSINPIAGEISPEIRAMVLALTNKFTSFFLPKKQRKVVDDLMRLDCQQQGLNSEDLAWLDSVAVVPRYPKIFPKLPRHYSELESVILRALKENAGFSAKYLKGKNKEYYPVRLIRREWVSYIVCAEDAINPVYREYAIHRFLQCQYVSAPINAKLTYSELEIEKKVIAGVDGVWCELEQLVIEVSGPPAQHLSEMRFHEVENKKQGQFTKFTALEMDGNRIKRVCIEVFGVPYTYELKTWILGLGANCKVIKAKPLSGNVNIMSDIIGEVSSMYKNYYDSNIEA
jgi:hypothetical protein